ncbi:hypothetical protein PkP19E3_25115 [Pseudomonas koreensis]|nr:hypothetical protein PkP19E3_25115 [Pseudomonas koreensis]
MLNQLAPSLASQRPQGSVLIAKLLNNNNHCGSWLASDEALMNSADPQRYLHLAAPTRIT